MEERGFNYNKAVMQSGMPTNNVNREYAAVGYSDAELGISGDEVGVSGDEAYPDNNPKSLRSIEIDPLSSGFLVRVGCQRIAIETPDKLIYMLTKYLTDPTKFEKEWYSKDVINKLDNIK